MIAVFNYYLDALDGITARRAEDLDEDQKRHIAWAYLKTARVDELHRIFTERLGAGWASFLGMYITEDITDKGTEILLDEVFSAIKSIVDDDLKKSDTEPSDNVINVHFANKERAESCKIPDVVA